jgi:dTDP-4-dehydrorhamnose 3,5-epimerase
MNIITTNLPGVIVIEPKVYVDKRGFFLETFREDVLLQAGINAHFVQDNHTRSSQGVLRGLHYQMTQTQGKLVRVAAGSVFDVVVDVRSGSPTFGQWYGTELNEDNIKMIYVPPGLHMVLLSYQKLLILFINVPIITILNQNKVLHGMIPI